MSELRYQSLTLYERELGDALLEGALVEPDIVASIDEFHAKGDKCAIIVVVKNQKLQESYVAKMNVAAAKFPFVQVDVFP